jgi:hypothetical protein
MQIAQLGCANVEKPYTISSKGKTHAKPNKVSTSHNNSWFIFCSVDGCNILNHLHNKWFVLIQNSF